MNPLGLEKLVTISLKRLHYNVKVYKCIHKEVHYQPVPNMQQRQVRIYGDCLSMEKIRHMQNIFYYVITHPGKAEFVSVILNPLNQCQQGVGNLHILMHMLVLIYKIHYHGMW